MIRFFRTEFQNDPLEKRRRFLTFKCTCEACENNYLMMPYLKQGPNPIPSELLLNGLAKMRSCDRNIAFKHLKMAKDYLQKNDKYIPCQQLVLMGEYYPHSMQLIYGSEVCLSVRCIPFEDDEPNNCRSS